MPVIKVSDRPAQTTARINAATPGGRFKDFEMTQPLLTKQSILIALITAAQLVLPAVVAVASLHLTLRLYRHAFEPSAAASVIVGVLCWLVFQPTRRRRAALPSSRTRAAAQLVVRWTILLTALPVLDHLVTDSPLEVYPRPVWITWALITLGAIVATTLGLQEIMRRFLIKAFDDRSAIIAGYNTGGIKLARRLKRNPEMRLEVAGFFDDRFDELKVMEPDAPIVGPLSDLGAYVRAHRIDVIFVALPNREVRGVMTLMDDLRDTTASIYYVPDSLAFDRIQPRSDQIQGIPVVAMCETPFYGFRGVGKRLNDIGLAALALILLSPLLLALTVLVKSSSPGPVLVKQRRYGLDGREIAIYKFRTRRVRAASSAGGAASRRDGGLTGIGRLLRRTSLDQLPQLLNVLQGRMSLVGPQPQAVTHCEEYRKLIKGFMVRHKVLPGMTGLAQINGYYEDTEDLADIQARVNWDLDYLRNWSPMLDLKILVRTLANVFRRDLRVGAPLADRLLTSTD